MQLILNLVYTILSTTLYVSFHFLGIKVPFSFQGFDRLFYNFSTHFFILFKLFNYSNPGLSTLIIYGPFFELTSIDATAPTLEVVIKQFAVGHWLAKAWQYQPEQ